MKLRKLLSLAFSGFREPQECEGCRRPFTCGASVTGCWCLKVKLGEEARGRLRAKYRRCLCRACLENAAQQQPDP